MPSLPPPDHLPGVVDKYVRTTCTLYYQCHPVPPEPNLPVEERKALRDLLNNLDLVITKADKGDITVILKASYYASLGYRHLHDPATYKKLMHDPTPQIVDRYVTWIKSLLEAKAIDESTYKFLRQPQTHAHSTSTSSPNYTKPL